MKRITVVLLIFITAVVFSLTGFLDDENIFNEITAEAPGIEKTPVLCGTAYDDGRININTASLASLCTIDGIGRAYAMRIIDFRTNNRRFEVPEDIMLVTGIGDSRFDEMKDKITVE